MLIQVLCLCIRRLPHLSRSTPSTRLGRVAVRDEDGTGQDGQVQRMGDGSPSLSSRLLKAKWVCTRKIDGETGRPSAYKARWVAKGYAQRAGIDYNELYAAVAHKDSVRVFLSLVNYHDYECDQVDIVAAFLNGDLEEEMFLEPPEGSDIPATRALRLRKSLHGLKQSPRYFNKSLDDWLKSQLCTHSSRPLHLLTGPEWQHDSNLNSR